MKSDAKYCCVGRYQSGAKESLAQAGHFMHSLLTIGQLLEYWEENGKVEKDKIESTRKHVKESK